MNKGKPLMCKKTMGFTLMFFGAIILGLGIYMVINKLNRKPEYIPIQSTPMFDNNYYGSYPSSAFNQNTRKESSISLFRDYVLGNPYTPPVKDDRAFVFNQGTVPINVPTSIGAVETNYRQNGILTPLNSSRDGNILPLMGRQTNTSRNKYQYYTMSNQNNGVKLPVSIGGKSGTDEYGVDEISNGDTVYVEGYNDAFKATIYDNATMRYLPNVI